jgi:hypothetical protein
LESPFWGSSFLLVAHGKLVPAIAEAFRRRGHPLLQAFALELPLAVANYDNTRGPRAAGRHHLRLWHTFALFALDP